MGGFVNSGRRCRMIRRRGNLRDTCARQLATKLLTLWIIDDCILFIKDTHCVFLPKFMLIFFILCVYVERHKRCVLTFFFFPVQNKSDTISSCAPGKTPMEDHMTSSDMAATGNISVPIVTGSIGTDPDPQVLCDRVKVCEQNAGSTIQSDNYLWNRWETGRKGIQWHTHAHARTCMHTWTHIHTCYYILTFGQGVISHITHTPGCTAHLHANTLLLTSTSLE